MHSEVEGQLIDERSVPGVVGHPVKFQLPPLRVPDTIMPVSDVVLPTPSHMVVDGHTSCCRRASPAGEGTFDHAVPVYACSEAMGVVTAVPLWTVALSG